MDARRLRPSAMLSRAFSANPTGNALPAIWDAALLLGPPACLRASRAAAQRASASILTLFSAYMCGNDCDKLSG